MMREFEELDLVNWMAHKPIDARDDHVDVEVVCVARARVEDS